MAADYGTLTALVKVVGAISSASVAIAFAWRGRTRWEPSEIDVSKGPQKVAGLLTTVAISLLWALCASTTDLPFLTRIAMGGGILCLLALLAYGILVATFTFTKPVGSKEGQNTTSNIIGGFRITKQAKRAVHGPGATLTLQEYFESVGYREDKVWPRLPRAAAKATFVLAYLLLTFSGTISLAATGIIVLLTQTHLPIPVDKKVAHFALILNGDVHYTRDIMEGFRTELDLLLKTTPFVAHYEHAIGIPRSDARDENLNILRGLIGRFQRKPDFLVTIGTVVSEVARQAYSNDFPIVFLGVTDPVKSGLVNGYAPDEKRGNIAGIGYGVTAPLFWAQLTNAFPAKKIGFVYNKAYSQDVYLLQDLEELARGACCNRLIGVEVTSPEIPPTQQSVADVFVGRYFVSTQIEKFVASTKKPFVGANVINVYKGAVLAVGADDPDTGRTAAREIIVPSLLKGIALKDLPVLVASKPIIGVNLKAARDLGVRIPEDVVRTASIRVDP